MSSRRASSPGRRGDDDEDNSAQIDLSAMDDAFAAAATGPVADGRYHVRVERVELRSSRFSREPLLRWTLRLVDDPAERRLFKNNVIRASSLHVLKHDLALCGLELARLSDLPAQLDHLRDHELEVTVRTAGSYQRVYFERAVPALSFP